VTFTNYHLLFILAPLDPMDEVSMPEGPTIEAWRAE